MHCGMIDQAANRGRAVGRAVGSPVDAGREVGTTRRTTVDSAVGADAERAAVGTGAAVDGNSSAGAAVDLSLIHI